MKRKIIDLNNNILCVYEGEISCTKNKLLRNKSNSKYLTFEIPNIFSLTLPVIS